jgi:hypothetical protein
MDTTIATIGERALRRLGVAIVAVANRPCCCSPDSAGDHRHARAH